MKIGREAVSECAGKRTQGAFIVLFFLSAVLALVLFSAKRDHPANRIGVVAEVPVDPLAVVLTPQTGGSATDQKISQLQQQVRDGRNVEVGLERLGWAFVAKARESFDPGFYKLAEQCALAIEKQHQQSQEAMLLRGHALQNLHRFKESEALSRQLVEQRGLSFDYGLLGDALMEQGKLDEAVEAYQRMMDLKPDLRAYVRAAHMRWLKGDLDGAIQVMRLAVGASSPLDAESAAWAITRLASYEFQAGRVEDAQRRCVLALSFRDNYPPTLLLQGKMLLALNKTSQAVDVLQMAEKLNPLPEYQWALAEALRATGGRETEAAAIEAQLRQHGATTDPRTFAIFLATQRDSPELALRLARAEFESRSDVFTHDALAWSLAAAGNFAEAHNEIERALAEGTMDGRLFFHAAMIASESGHDADVEPWLEKANKLAHMLLPSERNELQDLTARRANQKLAVAKKIPASPFEN